MRYPSSPWSLLPLLALLLAPRIAHAQLQAKPALPEGYAGSAECLDCHKKQLTHFSETIHSKVFFKSPRTALERLGCEACHGPGKAHAESGGDARALAVRHLSGQRAERRRGI